MKALRKKAASILLLAAFVCITLPGTAHAAAPKPAAPSITSVGIETTKSMLVQWKAVPNATGYHVYRAASQKGKYRKVAAVQASSYTDKKVRKNKTYYYKICAAGDGAVSAYSKPAGMRMDTARPVLTAKVSGTRKVKLSWKPVSGAKQYQVLTSTFKNKDYTTKTVSSRTSYTRSGLSAGKRYYFKVRTTSKKGGVMYNGLPSAIKSATTTKPKSSKTDVNQVIRLVNQYRAKEGLPALKTDPVLSAMAQKRAEEASVQFSHTRPDGSWFGSIADEYNFSKKIALENLALSYWEPFTPESLMTFWKISPGHWAVIMSNSVDYVGVGAYKDKKGDWYYALLTAREPKE